MSFQYNNPYSNAQQSLQQPNPSRPAFNTHSSTYTGGYQVLLGGLPADVSEFDVKELLTNAPLRLPTRSTTIRCLHSKEGDFLGMAIIGVSSERDAEAIRQEYYGQTIDSTHRLTVQHILPPTSDLPSSAPTFAQPLPTPPIPAPIPIFTPVKPRFPQAQLAQTQQSAQRNAQQIPVNKGKAPINGQAANSAIDKAPGLKLLARMNKTSGPVTSKKDQLALLAQQRANIKAGPGKALLSRLAKTNPTPSHSTTTKGKIQTARVSSGTGADKVNRAKANVNKNAMDVDVVMGNGSGNGQGKKKAKTQEELDEEMRVYERARRFGNA